MNVITRELPLIALGLLVTHISRPPTPTQRKAMALYFALEHIERIHSPPPPLPPDFRRWLDTPLELP